MSASTPPPPKRPKQVKVDEVSQLSNAALICRDPTLRHDYGVGDKIVAINVVNDRRSGRVKSYSTVLTCQRCGRHLVHDWVVDRVSHRVERVKTSRAYYPSHYLSSVGRLSADEVRFEQMQRFIQNGKRKN